MDLFNSAPDVTDHFDDVHSEVRERIARQASGGFDVVTEARMFRFRVPAQLGYSEGPEVRNIPPPPEPKN